ncbi:MAG TPA: TetR/AcrR family transcriptional regulator [Longimicrobiaceae bacterium]|nr:TetR/AcrR family transcriptional regulator [Longimicrobiaceae bacterium]
MSPRPRSATDAEIFAALTRVIGRLGPARMTLADVGAEAGITAGALVQRFGSKRGLLLALARTGVGGVHQQVAAIRRRHDGPLAALLDFATAMGRHVHTPEELANHLAFFQMDLTDPDFHEPALAYFRAERDALRSLLEEAVARGELSAAADPARLAEAVQVATNGARMVWAVVRDGTLEERTRVAVEILLAPYRAA